jgi:carbonic anhydrase
VPEEGGRRWRRTVEENVLEQLTNALGYPTVAGAVAAGDLAFHGWVFDLGSGALRVYHREAEGSERGVAARRRLAQPHAPRSGGGWPALVC